MAAAGEATAGVEAAAGVDVDATGATGGGTVLTAEAFRLGCLGFGLTLGDFGVLSFCSVGIAANLSLASLI